MANNGTIVVLGETTGELRCPFKCGDEDVTVDPVTGECSICHTVFEISKTEIILVPDNCSNCSFSRIRRTEPFCLNTKSSNYQTVTSLRFVCGCHRRGTQAEIFSSDGKKLYPIKE